MDLDIKQKFIERWKKYFNGIELPMIFYYTDREEKVERVQPPSGHQCVIGVLARVRKGKSICFDVQSVGCAGGRRYFGFNRDIMPNFEYFLSCGIPGKLDGERYKKTPELVKTFMKDFPTLEAPAEYIVFKRWDMIEASDEPEAVVFFSKPDVLSGLFTLANFDETGPNGVFAPFGAGCASIVQYPYLENRVERPRAVLGMFDVSARPYVPGETLTFAVPMRKFIQMIENMDESFLITPSWAKVKKRI
jgi:uncharacterized protein (DUF169 family)